MAVRIHNKQQVVAVLEKQFKSPMVVNLVHNKSVSGTTLKNRNKNDWLCAYFRPGSTFLFFFNMLLRIKNLHLPLWHKKLGRNVTASSPPSLLWLI
jgi:hypothetical protein